MKRLCSLVVLTMAAVLFSEALWGDDPKPSTPPVRVRRSLPQYWNKLGLSDEQKQQIYGVQAEYGIKIDALQKQIKDLQKKQREAMEKVLTEAQKTRLREIAAERLPKVTSPKSDKKPDAKPAAPTEKKP